MNRDIADMRQNYERGLLLEEHLDANPIVQFRSWFDTAKEQDILEPNAMTVATVDGDGIPAATTVLLKELTDEGFIFYTNYGSDKASNIDQNPNVSLLFLWKSIERQVRVTGTAQKVSREKSLAYFQSRPKASQIGAWTSPQSTVIKDRSIIESRLKDIQDQYADVDKLPLPVFWGGYIVEPHTIEFWQGRPSRLHDRLRYKKNQKGTWTIERLAP